MCGLGVLVWVVWQYLAVAVSIWTAVCCCLVYVCLCWFTVFCLVWLIVLLSFMSFSFVVLFVSCDCAWFVVAGVYFRC